MQNSQTLIDSFQWYRWLKNSAIWLDKSTLVNIFILQQFRRHLMTQFYESLTTTFLGHSWQLLLVFDWKRFFLKNLAVTHNLKWACNTMMNLGKTWWADYKKSFRQTSENMDNPNQRSCTLIYLIKIPSTEVTCHVGPVGQCSETTM